jgi:hypothetical protein
VLSNTGQLLFDVTLPGQGTDGNGTWTSCRHHCEGGTITARA